MGVVGVFASVDEAPDSAGAVGAVASVVDDVVVVVVVVDDDDDVVVVTVITDGNLSVLPLPAPPCGC